MICDQPDAASATALTYTGNGLSYNGVPLVQAPDTGVLTASSDPACQSPGGGVMTFPKGKNSRKPWPTCAVVSRSGMVIGHPRTHP